MNLHYPLRRAPLVVAGLLITLWGGLAAASVNLPDFTGLVEKHSPAVVNISTSQKIARREGPKIEMPDLPEGSPFGDLFRHFGLTADAIVPKIREHFEV